jgi:carboxylesterase
VRGVAQALADAGLTVELPLLPGHGTDVADMLPTRWEDWSAAADAAYRDLASRCAAVVVVGLSMGGTLSVWLSERHPEIAALVLVNPLIEPPDADAVAFIEAMIEGGDDIAPGIGSDIAMEGVTESAYPGSPLRAALSLFAGAGEVAAGLDRVTAPILLFSSTQDHVVPPASGDRLVAGVSGPVERIMLERSFHVATLDYDKEEIEARTVKFVTDLLPPSGA